MDCLTGAHRLEDLLTPHAGLDDIAITEASTDRSISYRDLVAAITTARSSLEQAGIRSGDIVALCGIKSIDLLTAAFATLACGAAYAFIDSDLPIDRLRTTLDICRPQIVISERVDVELADEISADFIGELTAGLRMLRRRAPAARRANSALAYVIFTSGSSGRPKGVQISHTAVLSFLRSAHSRVSYGTPLVFLNTSPFFFDASVLDIYLTLALGGRLVLAPKIVMPGQVTAAVEKYRVTDTLIVSSLLKLLASRFSDLHYRDASSLRTIWFGAEPCPVRVLSRLKQQIPHLTFIHGYGPTETTHTATMHITSAPGNEDEAYLPIGRPLDTVEVRVVGADLDPTPPGEVGELIISGHQLMDGYLNDEAANHAAFVEIDGVRFYRSNDLVRQDVNGELIFVGRRDDAVKIRGHLVYLGELETAALRLPGIEDAVAYAYDDAQEFKSLGLAVVTEQWSSTEDLVTRLLELLPQYMVPTRVSLVTTSSDDLLPTGKLNRKRIREQANTTGKPARLPQIVGGDRARLQPEEHIE